jgi:glycogen operon protein
MPMILMGDEVRRTQGGNNNAYCRDDETAWLDWTLMTQHADVHRFVTLLIARRLLRSVEHEHRRVSLTELLSQAQRTWHGVRLGEPDWSDESHSLAVTIGMQHEGLLFHLIVNAWWEPLEFALPAPDGDPAAGWRRWVDTARASPQDIVPWEEAPLLGLSAYRADARSVVVLFARRVSTP